MLMLGPFKVQVNAEGELGFEHRHNGTKFCVQPAAQRELFNLLSGLVLPAVSVEEFTLETDTFGGGTVEYRGGMQFHSSAAAESNVCLHYCSPGEISEVELPDPISTTPESLEAYASAFIEAAKWLRAMGRQLRENGGGA